MIRLNHVSKIYGDGSKKAVDDLSWDIEDGKITGFIGPNGAGKTTTLKMITGILAPSEGTIEINGKDIQKDPLEAKRQFGFVPDDPDAFLRVRGIEYLNFMADIYGVGTEERQHFIEETAKRFEMEENLSSRIMSYSHGMRQKIMVMGALIHKPPVWILDEPLTGLDPRSAHELKQMMRVKRDDAPGLRWRQCHIFFHPCAGSSGKTLRPHRHHPSRPPGIPGYPGRIKSGLSGSDT